MIGFNEVSSIKRWIYVLFLIIVITLVIGLFLNIPINQLAGSIIITSVLVISAVVFQKLGKQYHSQDDESGTR